jgi:hypothetical protein
LTYRGAHRGHPLADQEAKTFPKKEFVPGFSTRRVRDLLTFLSFSFAARDDLLGTLAILEVATLECKKRDVHTLEVREALDLL